MRYWDIIPLYRGRPCAVCPVCKYEEALIDSMIPTRCPRCNEKLGVKENEDN